MLTTDYVPGAPIWVDLGTPDVEAAAAFYGDLFGWEFQSAGPEAGGYGLFTLDGKVVAAVGPLTAEGATSSWTVYFHTADADATAKAVERAGGTVRFGPMDVFAQGRMATFSDPTCAAFAVWQPGEREGLDAVTDPGTLAWTELYTPDPERSKTFYRSVFGWEADDMPMRGFTYTVVRPGGTGQETAHGGVMGMNEEMLSAGVPAHWQPYFEVEDCDAVVARALEQGATSPMPGEDVEDVGRIAVLIDPFGAPFALLTSVSG